MLSSFFFFGDCRVIVTEHMKKCGVRTKEKIQWLMDIEKRPYTLNSHYYSDYKDKFLSFYRGRRQASNGNQLMANLKGYNPPTKHQSSTSFEAGMVQILTGLPQVGITGTNAVDLAKLLPPDPMEPALNIMAGVRAYFQGSYSGLIQVVASCLV
jgi:hypothetical protein